MLVLECLKRGVSSDSGFGSRCAKLIRKVLRAKHAFLTTSCTHAMEMALMSLGFKSGEKVLLPSFTFVSTANAVTARGGIPVFVEIDEETLNVDPEDLKRKITTDCVGVIPVHYAGAACDMATIARVAGDAGLWVIEDAAQAFGARYRGRHVGTFGDFGCFSFHYTKNLVCGEGGALVTNSEEMARAAEIVGEIGTDRSAFFRREVERYSWVRQGGKYALAEPLCALLAAQLSRFGDIQEGRSRIYSRYAEGLDPLVREGLIRLQRIPPWCTPNWHIFCFLVKSEKTRDRLLDFLRQRGIAATFHFVPLHSSPFARKNLKTKPADLPVTEKVARTLVRLPLFPTMTEPQVNRVIGAVREFFEPRLV